MDDVTMNIAATGSRTQIVNLAVSERTIQMLRDYAGLLEKQSGAPLQLDMETCVTMEDARLSTALEIMVVEALAGPTPFPIVTEFNYEPAPRVIDINPKMKGSGSR